MAIDDTILENGRLCDELTPPETGEESFNIIIQDGVVADNVADEEVFKNQRDADEVNTLENDNKGIEVCTNTLNEEAESSDSPVPEVLDIVVPASNDKEQVAISHKEDDTSQECHIQPQPEVVVIHGTAVIDNSPFNLLAQEEVESISRFITQKEHMKKNIENIEYSLLSSRNSEGDLFRHTVSLKVFVKTVNLWETPRSYIFRHVGQDAFSEEMVRISEY